MSNKLNHKLQGRALRAARTRSKVQGTADRPRLSVNISNLHISVQLIDDVAHNTIAAVSTIGNKDATGTMTVKAELIGREIAAKAKAANINTVVFDRGSKIYHGRVKALADAARAEGLEF